MSFDARSTAAGCFFTVVGIVVVSVALLELDVGTAFRMGPGYFPVLLGGLLTLLGAGIFAQGIRSRPPSPDTIAWRAVIFIGLAPVAFGLVVRGLGLAPAIAISAFLSTQASPEIGLRRALLVTAGLTIFCIFVFSYALDLSFRLIGPWLGG